MNIVKVMKSSVFVITFGLSIAVAGLIMILVYQVTVFSKRVTDFYAPTIHSVKSFEEAVKHVDMDIDSKGYPDRSSLMMLEESTKNLKSVSMNWDPDYRKHIEGMILTAENFLSKISKEGISKKEVQSHIRQLNKQATEHVKIHDTELYDAKTGIGRSALSIRAIAIVLLLMGCIVSYREVQMHRLREREQERLSAMKVLVSALDARDPYTKGHSSRVADYVVVLGKEMNIDKNMLEHLYMAGLMHDIGKIAVPDAILRKTGRLTDDEWKEMKKHPVATAKILGELESLKEIIPWVLYHHERYDGKGYPEGKAGLEIPLYAQILAVADSYDAMISTRPYRMEMDMDAVSAEIEANKGKQWKEDVADAFMRCLKSGLINKVLAKQEKLAIT
ncbi:MAG: HD-GYP domain-containing protein [Proteobacteria bacterium]|nr:HD-GYP domain-containing protein [Pseudomonadota bacterium]